MEVISYCSNGTKVRLSMKQVLYVPSLKRKLISLSACTDQGHTGVIQVNRIIIFGKEGTELFVANKVNKLYFVDIRELGSSLAYSSSSYEDDLTIWHERFAHINKMTIRKMVQNHSVDGLNCVLPDKSVPSAESIVDCEACALAKQPR